MRAADGMTAPISPLTGTQLMATASTTLTRGGYRPIETGLPAWNTPTTRLFEDEYNIVGIVVFETCAELVRMWPDYQGELVTVMSKHLGRNESKSWDGYLVLMTPSVAPSEDVEVHEIRQNTNFLRKLVGTGDNLVTSIDVERLLRPLLPIRLRNTTVEPRSVFDLLPDLLQREGITSSTTEAVLLAYREQRPLMEALMRNRVHR
jgi:hypothetical protein